MHAPEYLLVGFLAGAYVVLVLTALAGRREEPESEDVVVEASIGHNGKSD